MKSKGNIKKLLTLATLLVVAFFLVQTSFAQCETHFKTGYRKILAGFGDYKLEDWNGDGKLDFWTFRLNPNTSKQDVFVFLNNGNGDWNWNSPTIYTTTIPEFTGSDDLIEIIDWEGDGDKDIFFAQARTFHTLHKNNANGTFTASSTYVFFDAQVLTSIGFVDLNNDGRLDWIQHVNKPGMGNPIAYRLANADGTYGAVAVVSSTPDTFGSTHLLGDFTGDGKIDIIYTNGLTYRLLINAGSGNFTTTNASPTASTATNLMAARDFNADGISDVLAQLGPGSTENRRVFIYLGQASGNFVHFEIPVNNPAVGAGIRVGEFNGDNKPDFLENYDSEAGQSFYSVYINNGAGDFTRTDYPKSFGGYNTISADLNGDNKTDYFLKSRDGYYTGNIFGEQVIIIRYAQCQSFGEVKKANFDGSYRTDLVMWNTTSGDWISKDANWHSGSQATKTFNWGSSSLGDVPAPGDYDGDGRTDYSVYRNGEGNWYIYQSANSSWLVFRFGLAGDIPVPSDYDGGGKTDIAVFRPSDGNWHIWFTETQQYSAVHFGTNGDKPVAQDYDGDGKTDLAVYRPSEGNWYYLKSSDGNYAAIHWGISTDKPVPADYDGDGKADLTVFRDGIWYVLRSYNNLPGYFALETSGEVPMPFL
jgi:hypothetical protein